MTVLSQTDIVKRLMFVRHLYNIGVGQLTSQFPAASVLSFHHATESFLQLGIEHHDVKTGRHTEFIELFDELNKHLSGLELRSDSITLELRLNIRLLTLALRKRGNAGRGLKCFLR